jgi:hypothetical protein
MNVVNTRAIVDPDIAAKLTGRRGKNTFGLLYASDNAPGKLFARRARRIARLSAGTRKKSERRFHAQMPKLRALP